MVIPILAIGASLAGVLGWQIGGGVRDKFFGKSGVQEVTSIIKWVAIIGGGVVGVMFVSRVMK